MGKRILIGWELGSGHGHISILLPLARALADAGHEPILAICHLAGNTTWLSDPAIRAGRIRFVQAPVWKWNRVNACQAAIFADPLFNLCWDQPDNVELIARAWRGLIDLARPSAVIAELSPALSLATWGLVPTLVIGSGYNVPPPLSPLPPIRAYQPEVPSESRESERKIDAAIAEVVGRLGGHDAPTIGQLFGREGSFVCCSPQLDPYREHRRGQPHLGPLEKIAAAPTETPPGRRGRVFAYLDAENRHWSTAIAALAQIDAPVDVYGRGATPQMQRDHSNGRLTLHRKPLPMDQVLARSDLVVHHGGHTTAEACLRAGVPQFLLPKHLEQTVTTRALIALKVANGHTLGPQDTPARLARMIQSTLRGAAYFQAAKAVAAEIAWHDADALSTIVAAAGALV